jgi:polar amino acid transport system substrate-binding protein
MRTAGKRCGDPLKRFVRTLALAIATALAAPSAIAQQEMRLLAAELPPYTYQVPSASVSEQPGPGQGVVHDAVVEMARRVGHSGRIDYMPWFRAQEIAQTEPNVGILALTRSPEREEKYLWMVKVLTDDLVLVGAPGVDVSDMSKVKDRPVGVLVSSGAEALVKSLGFTKVSPQREEWMNAKRLKDRRIDAWVAPRAMVIHAVREVRGNLDVVQFGQVIRPSEIYLAASKNLPESEARKWQAAFAAMQADGTWAAIRRRYEQVKVDPVEDELRRIRHEPFN